MRWLVIIIIIILGVGFYLINAENTHSEIGKGKYQVIDPEEAKKRLNTEKGIILLDVRTLEEHREKRIPGSILLPVDQVEKEAAVKLPDKNATIFIYCRSGRRSAIAAEILINLGYTDVYDLGGIINWPYATESGE